MNDFDQYEDYEARFDPMNSDRQARRQRKPKAHHQAKKQQTAVIEEIADDTGNEVSFETTYKPGRFEEGWLLESLRPFYDRGLITDVLARVKGGKEANVYRCAAQPRKPGWSWSRRRSIARACSATCATTRCTATGANC